MKKIIFLLTLLISTVLSALAQNGVNQYDENGKRHGIWKKFYSNNRIRYSGNFDRGKEIGTFKYYSASNSDFPILVKNYNGSGNLAEVKFFAPGGVLESKGKMNGKLREGNWIYYHPDGESVMSEENYLNGKLDGEYKTFYISGEPTEITSYKNGLLNGSYKKYSIKGFLYQDFNYKTGELNGMAIYYSRKTGDLIKKGPFKNDLRVGTWENYVDGELVSTEQPAIKPEREKN